MSTRFVPNPAALNRLLRAPGGLVARDALRRGRRVQAAARRGVNSRTGRLAASIAVEPVTRNGVTGARVVATAPHAAIVHSGRGPVRARRGALVITGTTGAVIFRRSADAARPHPFLTDALREAVR